MSKNKSKFLIFIVGFLFFLFANDNFVRAEDYNVNIISIEGLVYGNKLKDATINATSDIEGEFSFYNQEMVLDDVGEMNFEVIFVPKDSSSVKRVVVVGEVSKREIAIVFDTPIYKQYDGTNTITLPNYTYTGIINDEVSIEGDLKGELLATYVGEGIPLSLSGADIIGEKSDCYYLDLFEHNARIYPNTLEKFGENATKIGIDKDLYVDIGYKLKVIKSECEDLIDNKYTSFYKFEYDVYSHNHQLLDIKSKYDVSMKISDSIMSKRRLEVFELTKEGEYKKLEYSYKDGEIRCVIDSESSIVFATRNIEWHFIMLFSLILLFSLAFVIIYRIKNSKIKENIKF